MTSQNSTIPDSAKEVIDKIDGALLYLHSSRMELFKAAHDKYTRPGGTKHLGFERLVASELFCCLKERFIERVFVEFPGIKRQRIDLVVDRDDGRVFIELKMYQSNPDAYKTDFKKLKAMMAKAGNPGCIAIQVHFNFYPNKNNSPIKMLRKCANPSPPNFWCNCLDAIPPNSEQSFARLAFGKSA